MPLLMVNPRSDRDFTALVDALVHLGVADPGELEARLRERYPRVAVRERTISDEREVTWYVYRDGRWMGTASC